jgi:lipopolysaccharide transport system ATP-binding protein
MSNSAIRAEGLSKLYRIGAQQQRHDTLRDQVVAGVRNLFRSNGRPKSEDLWALKDISFEIAHGEAVGFIGRNGAGKSTLLKILSRITKPTRGRAVICGRVGSLLEVGTGFHPELTGRENIYLNGAILGMKRAEINRKFDEIVDFAEIEKFIDTPVKRYSSGMYVRLAFAVAAHLEPEVLVVDEVLAVGDASFQKRCLGKMGDVAGQGRTVLFVSHNMTAINMLCKRAILLAEGKIERDGTAADVVAEYLRTDSESGGQCLWTDARRAPGNEQMRLRAVRIISEGEVTGDVDIDKEIKIEVEFWNLREDARNLAANIYILDSMGNTVLSTANTPSSNSLPDEWFYRQHERGLFRAACAIPGNFLNEGLYYINVYLITLGPLSVEARAEQALSFNVHDTGAMREAGGGARWDGVVRVRLPWETRFLEAIDREPATEKLAE